MVAPDSPPTPLAPLLVLVGPTASGKSSLALRLAEAFGGEIVACDAVTVFRGLDIGSAKASCEEQMRIPHHGLDLLTPDQPSTAGDYARAARHAIAGITHSRRLPLLVGGSGLYLRATLDGLAPAPPRDETLRERLRRHAARRGRGSLHRLLGRLDPLAAVQIHPNDQPKLIRSLEVTCLARRPQTTQWQAGRDALAGHRVLQLGLAPPRAELYTRINARAAGMFANGLLEETRHLLAQYGPTAPALNTLGYAQARQVLTGELALPEAIAAAQQGHRHYAKRQLTWFRRDSRIHWLHGFGDDPTIHTEAANLLQRHLTLGNVSEGTDAQ